MNWKLRNILQIFEHYAEKAMQDWQVPGMAAAIVAGGKTVYARGFGVKKASACDPVDNETVFQAGSISKSFTAALVSMLVDGGQLTWQDKVRDHLPDFHLSDPRATSEFAVGDLMAQCSGLPPHSGRLLPFLGFDRKYILKNLRHIKPISTFRSEYAYQNNLFLLAAALVEKYSERTWEQALAARILNPLSMAHTTCSLAGYRGSANKALGHYYNGPGPGSPVIPLPDNWPHHHWIYTIAPAGGLNSNVIDLARWLNLHLEQGVFDGKQLISRKNMRFIHTPKTAAGPGVWGETRYYCQGWVHSEYRPYPILWHNGGTSGMKSIIAMVPKAKVGIVILCNLYEPLLPEALSRFFFDLWFKKAERDWSRELLNKQKECAISLQEPDAPYTPPRPLAHYTGTFCSDLYGPVTVTRARSSLQVLLGPERIHLKLKHWGGDTFVLYWPGVLTTGTGVQFYANKRGIVDRLEIAGMDDDFTGSFLRHQPRRPGNP